MKIGRGDFAQDELLGLFQTPSSFAWPPCRPGKKGSQGTHLLSSHLPTSGVISSRVLRSSSNNFSLRVPELASPEAAVGTFLRGCLLRGGRAAAFPSSETHSLAWHTGVEVCAGQSLTRQRAAYGREVRFLPKAWAAIVGICRGNRIINQGFLERWCVGWISQPSEEEMILWMDEILHHFETTGNHCLSVFTGHLACW